MTDSEWQMLFDEREREFAALHHIEQRTPEQESKAKEIRHAFEILNIERDEILARRAAGELTDRSRMDAARRLIESLAEPANMRIRINEEEYRGDSLFAQYDPEAPICRDWKIVVIYDGNIEEFIEGHWLLFVEKVDQALQKFPFVQRGSREDWSVLEERDKRRLPPGLMAEIEEQEARLEPWAHRYLEYFRRLHHGEDAPLPDPPPDLLDHDVAAEYTRHRSSWVLDTWVWNDPPPQYKD